MGTALGTYKMASAVMKCRSLISGIKSGFFTTSVRSLSTSQCLGDSDSWFSKVFVRKIEPTKESHSRLLSDKEVIYEIQTHNVRPDLMENYVSNYEKYYKLIDASDVNAELVGSWSTIIGDQDQAFHVWRYVGGYAEIDKARSTFAKTLIIVKFGLNSGTVYEPDISNMF